MDSRALAATLPLPSLTERRSGEVVCHIDEALDPLGVTVAFSERTGGVSEPPFDSLNLGGHVGDDPDAVAENRRLLLGALGLSGAHLVVPEQTHGTRVAVVDRDTPLDRLAETDGLVTSTPGVAALLCFADCVPVVLVAPGPAVAVLHAGWRGVLGGIPAAGVHALARHAGCVPGSVNAYVGAHVGVCCYDVSPELRSRFEHAFGIMHGVGGRRLDLRAATSIGLIDAGVNACRIAHLDACTAENTHRFFSYRAEAGLTGRHGALACVRFR